MADWRITTKALAIATLALAATPRIYAQEAQLTLPAAAITQSSQAVVPTLVRYTGQLAAPLADPTATRVAVRCAIYPDQTSSQPLWTELQTISLDAQGKYSVILGAASPNGLPQSVFASGEARWLSISLASDASNSALQPRILLASVPYALKAADAESLAGHPAADFVTQESLSTQLSAQLAATAQSLALLAEQKVMPEAVTALTGAGTAGYVPVWTGASAIGNSGIVSSGSGTGTKVGIGIAAPTALLDVNGASNFRGAMTFSSQVLATASAGVNSPVLAMGASSYNSSTQTAVSQKFAWLATAQGNNTASPTSSLLFYSAQGTGGFVATGLGISPKGIITFASGQTFPGTGTGGGTTATIKAGNGLTAATSGTTETLAVDTTKVPLLTTPNSFTGNITIHGTTQQSNNPSGIIDGLIVYGTGGFESSAQGNPTLLGLNSDSQDEFSRGVEGDSVAGDGVQGFSQNKNGVLGSALGSGIGVRGLSASGIGVRGVAGNPASILANVEQYDVGVLAETSGGNAFGLGLIAAADNTEAAYILNNSTAPTVRIANAYSGGIVDVMVVGALSGGGCTFDSGGNIGCSGQVSSQAITQGGTRTLETYAVQSSESWIEDFGSATLANGTVTVTLDPTFADTANTTVPYHVFLTPRGDAQSLYITNITATSFEVHESGSGTHSIDFDFRIVAKPKGHEQQRLVDITDRLKARALAATRLQRKPGNPAQPKSDPNARPTPRGIHTQASVPTAR